MVTAQEVSNMFDQRQPGAGSDRQSTVRSPMVAEAEVSTAEARLTYWRNIRRVTVILLMVWLAVTLALPWFATELNQLRIGRFPLGFWMSAQGAVGIYVVLIVAYIWAVEKIEDAWHDADVAVDAGATALESRKGVAADVDLRRRIDD